MSKKVWPSGAVSVVVLPSGKQGEELLELAAQWSSSWLITPALWILADEIPVAAPTVGDEPPAVPKLMATILGRDESNQPSRAELDLFWTLGSQEFNLIRMVAVRTEQEIKEAERTSKAVSSAARYLEAALPRPSDPSVQNPDGAKMVKFNLVVARTEENRIVKDVLQHDFDANLIAAAEDRPTPQSFDSFVKDDSRYLGFVLAHIATTAGLWAGLPISASEFGGQKPTAYGLARLQRVFVRAVASDTLSADIAKWALDRANGDLQVQTLGKMDGREVATIAGDFEPAYLHQLVEYILDGPSDQSSGPLNFRYMEYQGKAFEIRRKTLREKFIWRMRDMAEALAALPRWYKAVASRRLDMALDPTDEAEDLYDVMPRRLAPKFEVQPPDIAAATAKPRLFKTNPELWAHVRTAISSSIDSPTKNHPNVLRDEQDRRLVFGDLARVLPDPKANWDPRKYLEGTAAVLHPVSWLDAEGVVRQIDAIKSRSDELAPGMQEAREQLQDTNDNVIETQAALNQALFELDRVELELTDDEEFAEEMRKDHTHKLPKDLVGPPRPSVFEDETPEVSAVNGGE